MGSLRNYSDAHRYLVILPGAVMSPQLQVLREYIKEVCGGDDAEKILDTAQTAHRGQVRRSGEAYIEHPIAVANIIKKYYPGERLLCTAALLHDTIEDAIDNGNYADEAELVDAIKLSYSNPSEGQEVLNIVYALTHGESMSYLDYVVSLAENEGALKIKLADMLHNLSSFPSPKQILKYGAAIRALGDLYGNPPPGIHPDHWSALEDIVNVAPKTT